MSDDEQFGHLFFHNIIGFSYLHTKQHFWFLFLKSPSTLSRKIPQTVVTLKPLCQIAVSIEKLHLNSIGRVDGRHFEEAQRWCRSGYTKISLKRLMSNSGRPKADIIVIILAYISLTRLIQVKSNKGRVLYMLDSSFF